MGERTPDAVFRGDLELGEAVGEAVAGRRGAAVPAFAHRHRLEVLAAGQLDGGRHGPAVQPDLPDLGTVRHRPDSKVIWPSRHDVGDESLVDGYHPDLDALGVDCGLAVGGRRDSCLQPLGLPFWSGVEAADADPAGDVSLCHHGVREHRHGGLDPCSGSVTEQPRVRVGR